MTNFAIQEKRFVAFPFFSFFWQQTRHVYFFFSFYHLYFQSALCLSIDLFSFLEHCFRFCRSLNLDPENYNKFLSVIQRSLHYVYHCLQPVGDQRRQTFSSALKTFKIQFSSVSERCVLEGKYREFPFL